MIITLDDLDEPLLNCQEQENNNLTLDTDSDTEYSEESYAKI